MLTSPYLVVAMTAAQALLAGCHRDGPDRRASGSEATPTNGIATSGPPRAHPNAGGIIVVLGSSTAAGTGPSKPENAWVQRYRAYLKGRFPEVQLINLGVGGYTTYQIQPSDYAPPAHRPAPDKNHNITFALGFAPKAIIINLPSNDADADYTEAEQLANFDRVTKLAGKNGVRCWVTTAQPRNFAGGTDAARQAKRNLLGSMRVAITQQYGDHTLDFWRPFARADGGIKPEWDAGDGTHLNDDAHALLVRAVIAAKITEAALGSTP